jgi:hypothetical protein
MTRTNSLRAAFESPRAFLEELITSSATPAADFAALTTRTKALEWLKLTKAVDLPSVAADRAKLSTEPAEARAAAVSVDAGSWSEADRAPHWATLGLECAAKANSGALASSQSVVRNKSQR